MLGRLQRLENGGRRVHLPQESQATEGSKARLAVEGGRNRGGNQIRYCKSLRNLFLYFTRANNAYACALPTLGVQ